MSQSCTRCKGNAALAHFTLEVEGKRPADCTMCRECLERGMRAKQPAIAGAILGFFDQFVWAKESAEPVWIKPLPQWTPKPVARVAREVEQLQLFG